ncbi:MULTISPECIES: ABC transporter permease [unclassified Streptomyces]|uniref:ABC transporter permease n=1 Tax=unclassified Streptomyces TaxID=2593676 RepID=UPI002E2EF83C|nr:MULTISPECIES: ABC transporter permease [unclassified Streptomyces]WUC68169.1 ABC transporter permease [Streptomyces sp. NBC_00539]
MSAVGQAATTARYTLIEYGRNRFAILLAATFIPGWTTTIYLDTHTTPVSFLLRADDVSVVVAGNRLMQLTGALNAVVLIIGFLTFAATFASHAFDHRLALAGYSRFRLVLGKLASLSLACALAAAYATASLCVFIAPARPVWVAGALFAGAMTYGAMGVVLGTVLRREVTGMFAVVMISLVDVSLQTPVASAIADSPLMILLPSYGAVQAATTAAFTTRSAVPAVAVQCLWFTAAAVVALAAFHRLTRVAHARTPRT